MLPRCYIASPLGFSEAGRSYYYREYLPALAKVVEPVDPWTLTSEEEVVAAREAGQEREFRNEIGRRNIQAIRDAALLVGFLDGQEPDAGTVAEVGFAVGLGLTCFGLRGDFRQSGEPGGRINLQVEAFIAASGGQIASTLEELVAVLSEANLHAPSGGAPASFSR
jgi:nucleoside 2-deoxyribosyltransferase